MEEIEKLSDLVKKAVPESFKWLKDERLNTVLVELEGDAIETTLEKIKDIFEKQLDSASIKDASRQEKSLIDSLFGVSAGQYLFTTELKEVLFFGAWWPWGNGLKVSLRIGLYTADSDVLSADKIMKILTWVFPVS